MSDTTEDILETMRMQLHEMELDHVQLAGRIMQHRTNMALVENGPRRRGGRPRKGNLMQLGPDGIVRPIEMPQRVEGGIAETETEESAA